MCGDGQGQGTGAGCDGAACVDTRRKQTPPRAPDNRYSYDYGRCRRG